MSLSDQIAASLPYLRRYARALTGSQSQGDTIVRATLETALANEDLKASFAQGRVPLYRAFTEAWQNTSSEPTGNDTASEMHEGKAQERLNLVTPLNRQALLLTTLEEFQPIDAATILGVSASEVNSLVAEAIDEIDRETSTNVLIIEDEPLISMQLEELVKSLGHEVFACAATRAQAKEAVANKMPGIVLADIQLADGSSGLDAVDDIHEVADVPVVFITAYPERLLTGDRPEPTYLVTKPFREEAVRTAMSQALFFKSGKPVG